MGRGVGPTKEITLAVVATTLSLVVIFLPIAFMSGARGAVLLLLRRDLRGRDPLSMVVSFTLTPMLCSRFLKLSKKAKAAGAAHHSGGIYGMWSRSLISGACAGRCGTGG